MRKAGALVKIDKLRQQAKELEVLNSELASLKSTKVYKKKGSGNVLFLANKASVFNEYKGILDDVKRKLEIAERELMEQS